jgi:hypothetical protein
MSDTSAYVSIRQEAEKRFVLVSAALHVLINYLINHVMKLTWSSQDSCPSKWPIFVLTYADVC